MLTLSASASNNKLDVALARALRLTLERLETNPAVSMVVIQGIEGYFSSGSDLKAISDLANGVGKYAGASPEVKRLALSSIKEQYKLHHLVATYTKPVVSSLTGVAMGSGWSLAAHTPYSYSCESTSISLPEASLGLIPHGGSSYYLSRLPNGVGMWAAMTGAVIQGEEAYWAGFTSLCSTEEDLNTTLLSEAGALSGGISATGYRLEEDPVYRKAVKVLTDYRDDGKIEFIGNGIGEEVSGELAEEYFRLKKWYSHWAAGDKASANEVLSGGPMEDDGDLFDLFQGSEVYGDQGANWSRGSPFMAPKHAAAERRARLGAISAHSAAIFKGALSDNPDNITAAKLGVVRRCFGGQTSTSGTHNDPVLTVQGQEEPQAAAIRKRAMVIAKLARDAASGTNKNVPATIPADWEARLAGKNMTGGLQAMVLETLTYLHLDAVVEGSKDAQDLASKGIKTPVLPSLPVLVEMVRQAVAATWPTGQLTEAVLSQILSKYVKGYGQGGAAAAVATGARGPANAELRELMRAAVARVSASLHGLPTWFLIDPVQASEAKRRKEHAKAIRAATSKSTPVDDPLLVGPSGFTVPHVPGVVESPNGEIYPVNPRLFSDPQGLWMNGAPDGGDIWWPFSLGRWEGEINFTGERDSVVVTPLIGALRPVPDMNPTTMAVSTAREDCLRLLYASGLGTNAYVTSATNLAVAGTDGRENTMNNLLQESGLAQLKKLEEAYIAKDKSAGEVNPGDTAPFDAALTKAKASLVWPQLTNRVAKMRYLVYQGMARTAAVEVTQEQLIELVRCSPDTPQGAAYLEGEAEKGVPKAKELLQLFKKIVTACDAGADAPPNVTLTDAEKTEIAQLASSFAEWESVVAGSETGGVWTTVGVSGANTSTSNSSQFTLVSVTDAETGFPRLALRKKDGRQAPPAPPGMPATLEEAKYRLMRAGAFNLSDSQTPFDRLDVAPGIGAGGVAASDASTPFVSPIPTEPKATESTRDLGLAWDWDIVLKALTDVTGKGAIDLFGLPQTGRTQAAGALVASYFRNEAEGRRSLPIARSVGEIKDRLAMEANARTNGDAAAGFGREFAASTLERLNSAPQESLRATHALLLRASASPLEECMRMEWRALSRLITGTVPTGALQEGGDPSALFAPLENPKDELSFPHRTEAEAIVKARQREQTQWEIDMESYIASGEGNGYFADLFRRRYAWYKDPLTHTPYDAEMGEKVLLDELNEREKANEPDPVQEARAALGLPREPTTTERGSRRLQASIRGEEAEVEEVAFQMAVDSAVLRIASDVSRQVRKAKEVKDAANASEPMDGAGVVSSLRGLPQWLKE